MDRPCLVCNSGRQRCSESDMCYECLSPDAIQDRHDELTQHYADADDEREQWQPPAGAENQSHHDRGHLLTENIRLQIQLLNANRDFDMVTASNLKLTYAIEKAEDKLNGINYYAKIKRMDEAEAKLKVIGDVLRMDVPAQSRISNALAHLDS